MLSEQVPSSASLSDQVPTKVRPSARSIHSCGSRGDQGDQSRLTHDKPNQLRRRRGKARKDSRAALKTRLATMDAMDRKQARDAVDAIGTSEDTPEVRETPCRVEDLQLAVGVEKEVAEKRGQWWDPRMKGGCGTVDAAPLEGVGRSVNEIRLRAKSCRQTMIEWARRRFARRKIAR